jgi:hypothetical protein
VFAFENESQIFKKVDEFRSLDVRPGHLITLLHKALQLIQVETHMDDVCMIVLKAKLIFYEFWLYLILHCFRMDLKGNAKLACPF